MFILKSQSLHLYRSFLRKLREAPKDVQGAWQRLLAYWRCGSNNRGDERWHGAAGELHEQVRSAFERARGQQDPYAIKYTLSDGRTQLKQLTDLLALRR